MKQELMKNIGDIAVGIAKEGLEKSIGKSQATGNSTDRRSGSSMDMISSLLKNVGGKSSGAGSGGGGGRGRGGGGGGGRGGCAGGGRGSGGGSGSSQR